MDIVSKLNTAVAIAIEKGISRKFTAWVVATVALFTSFIDGSAWMYITLLYIGIQTSLDFLKGYKQG